MASKFKILSFDRGAWHTLSKCTKQEEKQKSSSPPSISFSQLEQLVEKMMRVRKNDKKYYLEVIDEVGEEAEIITEDNITNNKIVEKIPNEFQVESEAVINPPPTPTISGTG